VYPTGQKTDNGSQMPADCEYQKLGAQGLMFGVTIVRQVVRLIASEPAGQFGFINVENCTFAGTFPLRMEAVQVRFFGIGPPLTRNTVTLRFMVPLEGAVSLEPRKDAGPQVTFTCALPWTEPLETVNIKDCGTLF
jgi:hypothetical protein